MPQANNEDGELHLSQSQVRALARVLAIHSFDVIRRMLGRDRENRDEMLAVLTREIRESINNHLAEAAETQPSESDMQDARRAWQRIHEELDREFDELMERWKEEDGGLF